MASALLFLRSTNADPNAVGIFGKLPSTTSKSSTFSSSFFDNFLLDAKTPCFPFLGSYLLCIFYLWNITKEPQNHRSPPCFIFRLWVFLFSDSDSFFHPAVRHPISLVGSAAKPASQKKWGVQTFSFSPARPIPPPSGKSLGGANFWPLSKIGRSCKNPPIKKKPGRSSKKRRSGALDVFFFSAISGNSTT